ncbi:MAG: antibiotic biosynthesis monooxygenase [Rhodobacteraceae bacterium]|nr:antibiotic biosynthesis monooxygenase [Paracoccaceae bacterium]
MIREIANLTIDPANAAAFEAAVARAVPLFRAAPDCFGVHLERVIEEPGRYRLVVQWASVAAHTEVFRASPAFQEWRALAGPFFSEPPHVVHTEQVV